MSTAPQSADLVLHGRHADVPIVTINRLDGSNRREILVLQGNLRGR